MSQKMQPATVGGYNQKDHQTTPALMTACHGDAMHCGYMTTKGGNEKVYAMAKQLAGGRRKPTSSLSRQRRKQTSPFRHWRKQRGGSAICPAAVPEGTSTWPTFHGQNGPFSTAQNANTASQHNNALNASTKAQAMYDGAAADVPSGLMGTPQAGGSYGDLTRSGMKRASRYARADRTRRRKLMRQRWAKGLTRRGKPRRGTKKHKRKKTRTRSKRHRASRRRRGGGSRTWKLCSRRKKGGHKKKHQGWGCYSGGYNHGGHLFSDFRDRLNMGFRYPTE